MSDQTPPVLYINKGTTVLHADREYLITHILDFNLVLAKEVASGEKVKLSLDELTPAKRLGKIERASKSLDLDEIGDHQWSIAELRLEAIKPLIEGTGQHAAYRTAAAQCQVSVATIYRWLEAYRSTGLLSSLLPTKRTGGAGKGRISEEVEAIIQDQVQNFYLTDKHPSLAAVVKEVRRLCANAGLKLPAPNTVRLRVEWIADRERVKRRHGEKRARELFDPNRGPIPDADWPLAIVMMDHTLLPIIIVDDVHRRPINRAWLTLAIDAYSRACLGMHLSLDPPSAMSAGLCATHAIFPKEKWLAKLGLSDIDWPFYGVMDVLHLDNAKEFRGNMLATACKEYGIDIQLRPVKKPHYGAYIERLMGTVTERLKVVDGATYSGPKEKGEYDAEGNACMTFEEVEKWLVLMFARYHREIHSGIGTSPLAKWREGIFGTKGKIGRGIPARRNDEENVRINFMPYEERTVQDYGVLIDVHYWHDVLRPWINAKDPDNPKLGRKFKFRRDPRDISQLYFFDPDLERFFAIPYRDTSLPPVSIWEWRAAKSEAKSLGVEQDDERAVFGLINRQREIEAHAAQAKKAARRASQRRALQEKSRQDRPTVLPMVSAPAPTTPPAVLNGYNPDEVLAYEDDY